MTQRLQHLSVQHTHAEEALQSIIQEANIVEYELRVARSAVRRDRTTCTNTANINTNNFSVGNTVRITKKYRAEEQGAEGTVTCLPQHTLILGTKGRGRHIEGIGATWW